MTGTAFCAQARSSYLDARVAAGAAFLPDLGELVSAGIGAARHGTDRTLCIAATRPRAAYGPRVLHRGPLGSGGGRELVVVCAVPERPDPVDISLELLDRALWAEGVLRAQIGVRRAEPGRWPTAQISVELRSVDPAEDPAAVASRLEGWRTAVEARAAGSVGVLWAAAQGPGAPGRRQLR